MLQIKIIKGGLAEDLNETVNEFLATIHEDAVKDISVDVMKGTAVIQYVVKNAWADRLCSECKYWDDSGSSDAVSGLCHECGGRRRFNCKACAKFKDVRA